MATTLRTGMPGDGGEFNPAAIRSMSGRTAYVVGDLPTPSAGLQFTRTWVLDSNSFTFGGIVAAGGTDIVPVYCDGTNWRIG